MTAAPDFLPRMLTKEQAADYAAGGSLVRFDRWRRSGMMPGRVPGTTLFDRLALDAAIDKMTGAAKATAPVALSPLELWKKQRDERKHSRR